VLDAAFQWHGTLYAATVTSSGMFTVATSRRFCGRVAATAFTMSDDPAWCQKKLEALRNATFPAPRPALVASPRHGSPSGGLLHSIREYRAHLGRLAGYSSHLEHAVANIGCRDARSYLYALKSNALREDLVQHGRRAVRSTRWSGCRGSLIYLGRTSGREGLRVRGSWRPAAWKD